MNFSFKQELKKTHIHKIMRLGVTEENRIELTRTATLPYNERNKTEKWNWESGRMAEHTAHAREINFRAFVCVCVVSARACVDWRGDYTQRKRWLCGSPCVNFLSLVTIEMRCSQCCTIVMHFAWCWRKTWCGWKIQSNSNRFASYWYVALEAHVFVSCTRTLWDLCMYLVREKMWVMNLCLLDWYRVYRTDRE